MPNAAAQNGDREYRCGMNFKAIIERDLATGLLVCSVPGIPGAHSQGEAIEEVRENLAEVIELLRGENALEPHPIKKAP